MCPLESIIKCGLSHCRVAPALDYQETAGEVK